MKIFFFLNPTDRNKTKQNVGLIKAGGKQHGHRIMNVQKWYYYLCQLTDNDLTLISEE